MSGTAMKRRIRDLNWISALPQDDFRGHKRFYKRPLSTSVFSDHVPLLFELQQKSLGAGNAAPLERLLIDGSCKGKAVQFLADEMKITAGTVFPDVVGLGRFLRWHFESLRTMLL